MNELTIIPLEIQARGEVTKSNINEFREALTLIIGAINRDLKTDEEFGQAEQDVKGLKGAEDALKKAKEKAISDAETLHALFSTMDEVSAEAREARLGLEKQINKRKEEIRGELLAEGYEELICEKTPKAAAKFKPMFEEAIKGKRNLKSMREAVGDVVLTQNKILADCAAMLDKFEKTNGISLLMDRGDLGLARDVEILSAELNRRLEIQKAEAEKMRMAAELDEAKAAAEAERKKAEEELAKARAAQVVPEQAQTAPELAQEKSPPNQGNSGACASESLTSEEMAQQEAEEWEAFAVEVKAAFSTLKDERATLKHAANIEKAAAFSLGCGEAWKKANSKKEEATA